MMYTAARSSPENARGMSSLKTSSFNAVSDLDTNETDSHVCVNEGSLFAQSDQCACTNSP